MIILILRRRKIVIFLLNIFMIFEITISIKQDKKSLIIIN